MKQKDVNLCHKPKAKDLIMNSNFSDLIASIFLLFWSFVIVMVAIKSVSNIFKGK